LGFRQRDGGKAMIGIYVVAGAVALGLFVYLFFALLKPEWFS
jgi:K+-transporting ATPase KdpF subunit